MFEVGNPEWRRGLAVLEIREEGGVLKGCIPSCRGVDFFLDNPFAYFLKYSQVFALKLPITATFYGNKKSLRYWESTVYVIYHNKFVIFYSF